MPHIPNNETLFSIPEYFLSQYMSCFRLYFHISCSLSCSLRSPAPLVASCQGSSSLVLSIAVGRLAYQNWLAVQHWTKQFGTASSEITLQNPSSKITCRYCRTDSMDPENLVGTGGTPQVSRSIWRENRKLWPAETA